MNPRTTLADKACDRGFFIFRFEQLYERLTRAQSDDARPVRIVQRDFPQTQHVAEKRQRLREGLNGDSNVRNARPARG